MMMRNVEKGQEKKVEFCCKNEGEYIIDDEPECGGTVRIPEHETKNLLPRILKVPMSDVSWCYPESPRISAILSKYEDPDTGRIRELHEFGKEIRSGDESFSIQTSSYWDDHSKRKVFSLICPCCKESLMYNERKAAEYWRRKRNEDPVV